MSNIGPPTQDVTDAAIVRPAERQMMNQGGCHDCEDHPGRQGRRHRQHRTHRQARRCRALLAERRIGACSILGAERRIAGILSERDIVRVLAERGSAVLEEPVGQSDDAQGLTCTRSETVAGVMERMTAGKFRHVPVVEQNRLIGIVSIGDVVKHRLNEMEHNSAALRDYIQSA